MCRMTQISRFSMVMFSSVMLSFSLFPLSASAANRSGQEQIYQIASTAAIKSVELVSDPQTTTYEVGQGFKASEISFKVYYKDGISKTIKHDSLKYTANGQTVTNGYKWKTVGNKHIAVTE